MSSPAKPLVGSWRQDARAVQVIRFAFTVTTAMAIAQAVNWPLSFVYVALVIGLVPMAPTPRGTLNGIVYALVAYPCGLALTLLFLPYPTSFIIFFSLAFFLTVYFAHKGAPFDLILFIVLSVVLFPILGSKSEGLTSYVAGSLMFSSVLTLLTVQAAHALLPDPEPPDQAAGSAYRRGYCPEAARGALKATVAVAPLMTAFLLLDLAAYAVVLIYAALTALGGSLESGRYNANKNLIANTIGGIAALVFYALMVAVPAFHFFVVLTLATSLLFGARLFSDAPGAKYFGSALTGLVILISSSMGAGADIDANVVLRVVYIVIAGMYVIGVMAAMERTWPDAGGDTNGH